MPFQHQPKAAPLLTASPTAIAIGDDADSALLFSVTSPEGESFIAFDHHFGDLDTAQTPVFTTDAEPSAFNSGAGLLVTEHGTQSIDQEQAQDLVLQEIHAEHQDQHQDKLVAESESKPELFRTIQTSAQGLGTGSVLRARQPYFKGFSLLFFVLLVHACLFLLICILWRPQLNPFGLTETESRGPKVTAIKAYFIYAPAVEKAETSESKTEIKAEDKTEATSSVTPTIVPTPQTQVKPLPILEKVMPETIAPEKAVSEKVESEKVNPDTVKPNITQSSQSQSKKTQSSAQSEVQPAEVTAKKPTNTLDTTEMKPQLGAKSSPAAEGESTIATSSSMSLFTQQYFERQREQALDALVIEQADKFTRKSNMSEMSPEMEVLFVPNADDFGGTTSLDLPLDPNRIVRKGDTCYRVVQVGTQVNPNAENLGFPINCSGKKINQVIDDAIQSRLNKMMLKPHK
ncbi:hypothetical protein L5M43_10040 [Shewanella sp. SW36]|uniref:hypothetical protein n=1 Tax=unclassified Shewanella TaxID=196818 RepID=UPI0021D937A7|nr:MULTISPECIES: hypothetical protein [unclassified Shewanella]MCU7975602.1 hypothetical protein [Shewanella sp. SW36]MCU7990991.1 hypothetical protein [Shewanella sp. SW1]MCU8018302.1 hypothetical protein [Shewanella sp. SM72]MCU8051551.1 hypothetical protein [Shewanella sp. SM43]